MSRTERAELVLDIARRVLAERDDGRSVDPQRIQWAEAVLRGNAEPVAAPQNEEASHA